MGENTCYLRMEILSYFIDSAQKMFCDNEEDKRSNLGKPFQANITMNLPHVCL